MITLFFNVENAEGIMPINDLLCGKNDQIDYESVCEKYQWILEKGRRCILSPDSDGLLCGLFMSHFFDWNIAGFYDGKIAIINRDFKGDKKTITIKNFLEFIENKPLSWAMTSSDNIEYTLEEPDKLLQ
ncbi:MAG: hypothetical protein LBT05_02585 [Planctomycetaceae bacterium]|jgi:hypothetical protein|nr:hypothetical protein [Planctomycetaceae bacterium]